MKAEVDVSDVSDEKYDFLLVKTKVTEKNNRLSRRDCYVCKDKLAENGKKRKRDKYVCRDHPALFICNDDSRECYRQHIKTHHDIDLIE